MSKDLSVSAGEEPCLLCYRKLTDVIGSAIVFLPHKGKSMQNLPVSKAEASLAGLAGEIKVAVAL